MDEIKVKEKNDERAVGILEVFGLTTAFLAADAGCKAADVTLENFDKNKPANADALPVPLLVTVKFRGSVTDVEAALKQPKRLRQRERVLYRVTLFQDLQQIAAKC